MRRRGESGKRMGARYGCTDVDEVITCDRRGAFSGSRGVGGSSGTHSKLRCTTPLLGGGGVGGVEEMAEVRRLAADLAADLSRPASSLSLRASST